MPAPKPHVQRRLAQLQAENEELFDELFLMELPERQAAIDGMDPAHRRQLRAMADTEAGKLYGEMGRATKLLDGRIATAEEWLDSMTRDELRDWRRAARHRASTCKSIILICVEVEKARIAARRA